MLQIAKTCQRTAASQLPEFSMKDLKILTNQCQSLSAINRRRQKRTKQIIERNTGNRLSPVTHRKGQNQIATVQK